MAYALDKEKGKKEHSNHPQSSRIQNEIPSGIQWNSHRHQDWFINHVKRWDQRPRAFHFSSFETAQPNWQGRENNVFRLKENIIYYSQLLSVQGPPCYYAPIWNKGQSTSELTWAKLKEVLQGFLYPVPQNLGLNVSMHTYGSWKPYKVKNFDTVSLYCLGRPSVTRHFFIRRSQGESVGGEGHVLTQVEK